MKTKLLILTGMIVAPLSMAFAADNAKTDTSSTDANGTSVTTSASHENSVGLTGTQKSTEDEKTVVDPKGMMNATTAKRHAERQVSPSGDVSESVTVDHANGTREDVSAKRATSEHWLDKGNTTTTVHSRVVDPKGLGNKHTSEVKEEVERNADGTVKKTVTKKLDGDTVSKEMSATR